MIPKEEYIKVLKALGNTGNIHICEFCKHYTPCLRKECDEYISGDTCYDEQGNERNWKWTCLDFNFGDCPKLDSTPCYQCIENDLQAFSWNGQFFTKAKSGVPL